MTLNMTGQGRPPPRKKKRSLSFPKLKWLIPKGQAVVPGNPKFPDRRSKISVPKFDNDKDNAETDDEDEDVYRY
jgi:hypothetical protein